MPLAGPDRAAWRTPLLLLGGLLACRAEHETTGDAILDGQGLPDCEASYTEADTCPALKGWRSSAPDEFTADATSAYPIRWIGTEVQPAFCADDADEAEAWVMEMSPDVDGSTHTVRKADPRWTDIGRWDADGAFIQYDRVMHCDFVAEQALTPPTTTNIERLLVYAGTPDADEDFFPVMREMSRWRETPLTIQAVLSYGEAHTESYRLRVCDVRCGECDDPYGNVRNVTGVVEQQDWVYDPTSNAVSFEVKSLYEGECQIKR